MAVKKRIARFNRIEVNTGTTEDPEWTRVFALNRNKLTIEATEVDVTDGDSGGWDDSLTTSRKWSIEGAGFDAYTGSEAAQVDDPGQAFLKAKGLLTGPEAYVDVRIFRTDNNKGFTGRATANWGGMGDEVKAAEPFACNFTGSGLLAAFTYEP